MFFFFPSNVKLFSRLFLQHTIPWTPWLVSSLYDSVHPSNLAITSFQVKIKKNIFKCFCYNTTQTRNRNPGSFPTDRLLYVQVDFFFFLCDKSPRRETGAASLSLSPGLSQCSAHKSSWMSAHLALCKRMRLCQQPAEKHHSGCSGLCSYSFSHL